ncbi:hypothetical protein JOD02_001150 [Caldicoprobacter guelmensis]|nr:hypothetical protein [Caldicoprobacter guelmensis]
MPWLESRRGCEHPLRKSREGHLGAGLLNGSRQTRRWALRGEWEKVASPRRVVPRAGEPLVPYLY